MQCVMDHIVLNVEDAERMLAFYCDVLQMGPERVDAFRAGQVPFPSVRLNADTVIDLFPKALWQGQGASEGSRLNHFCLSMSEAEWQALQRRLAAHEVAIDDGPAARWGARGSGTSIYFRDPEGNVIEARYYEAASGTAACLLGS